MIHCNLLLVLFAFLTMSQAFTTSSSCSFATSTSSTTSLHAEGTGGWGLSNSREMVPEEFAKRGGERKAFEGYKLSDRGEFMRSVTAAKNNQKNDELQELLGVAKLAGISVKNPSERLNKFEDEVLKDDDEELDLSV
jgi:hypothetical protein